MWHAHGAVIPTCSTPILRLHTIYGTTPPPVVDATPPHDDTGICPLRLLSKSANRTTRGHGPHKDGHVDSRRGEKACNFTYACGDGKTLPFCLKTGLKPSANSPELEGQRRLHSCLCHQPTHLVLFLVPTSISPSLQACAELRALSPLQESISP